MDIKNLENQGNANKGFLEITKINEHVYIALLYSHVELITNFFNP
jgi:hypothetical protein